MSVLIKKKGPDTKLKKKKIIRKVQLHVTKKRQANWEKK